MSTTDQVTSVTNAIPPASMPDYHERLEQAAEAAVMEPLAGWNTKETPVIRRTNNEEMEPIRLAIDECKIIHLLDIDKWRLSIEHYAVSASPISAAKHLADICEITARNLRQWAGNLDAAIAKKGGQP